MHTFFNDVFELVPVEIAPDPTANLSHTDQQQESEELNQEKVTRTNNQQAHLTNFNSR